MEISSCRPLPGVPMIRQQVESFLRIVDEIRSFRSLDADLIPHIDDFAKRGILPGEDDDMDSLSFDLQSLRESFSELDIFLNTLSIHKGHLSYRKVMEILMAEELVIKRENEPTHTESMIKPAKARKKKSQATSPIKKSIATQGKLQPLTSTRASQEPFKSESRGKPKMKSEDFVAKSRTRQSTGISGFSLSHSRQTSCQRPFISFQKDNTHFADFQARFVTSSKLEIDSTPKRDHLEWNQSTANGLPSAEPLGRIPLGSHRVSFHLSQLLSPYTIQAIHREPTRTRKPPHRPTRTAESLAKEARIDLVFPEPPEPKFKVVHLPSRLTGVSPIILQLLRKAMNDKTAVRQTKESPTPESNSKLPHIFLHA